jgi:hypothetical protein
MYATNCRIEELVVPLVAKSRSQPTKKYSIHNSKIAHCKT